MKCRFRTFYFNPFSDYFRRYIENSGDDLIWLLCTVRTYVNQAICVLVRYTTKNNCLPSTSTSFIYVPFGIVTTNAAKADWITSSSISRENLLLLSWIVRHYIQRKPTIIYEICFRHQINQFCCLTEFNDIRQVSTSSITMHRYSFRRDGHSMKWTDMAAHFCGQCEVRINDYWKVCLARFWWSCVRWCMIQGHKWI